MIFLKMLIGIGVLICLLLLLPVGADVSFADGQLRLYLRIWHVKKCLYPPSRKAKKRDKSSSVRAQSGEKKKMRMPDVTSEEVASVIAVVIRAIGKLRFHLHLLKLHFVSAFPDPYRTAMVYGYVSAAVSALGLPRMSQADVQLGANFEEEACYIDGYVSVTIRIWYICKLAVSLLWGGIPILRNRSKRLKQQCSMSAQGKEA